MITYPVLVQRIRALTADQGDHLSDQDVADALREALAIYGRDVPPVVTLDLTADGTSASLALPSPYVGGWSRVQAVVSPADALPATLLDADTWTVVPTPDGDRLVLDAIPAAGTTYRLMVTVPATITVLDGATTTTVPEHHVPAVTALAAARLLMRLANRFVHEQETAALFADGIDRLSKSDIAARRARELLADYRAAVGLDADGSPAGVTPVLRVVDWDLPATGPSWLTHLGSWR